jgi:deferrochelatase/peroxidase EfeB
MRKSGDAVNRQRGIRRRTAATVLAAGAVGSAGAVLATLHRSGPGKDGPGMSRHVLRRLSSLPPDHGLLIALDVRGDRAQTTAGLRKLYATASRPDGPAEIGLGLGASFFDTVARIRRRPRSLTVMAGFPGDLLGPGETHGDVLLYVAAHTAAQVEAGEHALRAAVPHWSLRWRVLMRRDDNHMAYGHPASRNGLGYTEGLGNPGTSAQLADTALVAPGDGEPDWAVGGSYQVVRRIRLATERWNDHLQTERDRIIGRRPDGTWLDGRAADARPNFTADPLGRTTPLDAHVRLANPAAQHGTPVPLVRRSYSSADPADGQGLVFVCYQRSLVNGFTAVQHRLTGEALADYLLTTGGGYWFTPRPGPSWLDQLFA